MKKLFIFPIIILIVSSCYKDDNIGISGCNYIFPDTSYLHPKNIDFTLWLENHQKIGFPGLVLALLDSNGLWLGAKGYASIEQKIPMKICHLHHSASICKTYIAVCVLKLYENGQLDIDEKAVNYLPDNLPDIANLKEVTIKQLLNHSSGIPDFMTDLMSYIEPINNPFINNSWKDYLEKYVAGRAALFNCGEKHEYCNTNYLLLGLIVENAYKQSLGDAVHNILLAPYGLTETYYKSSLGYPNVSGVTENYFSQFNGYIQNGTKYQQHFANIAIGHEGIIASSRDYVMFLDKLMNNEILKPETMQIMTNVSESIYGLGVVKEEYDNGYVIGHTGGGFGTMTFLFHIKETNTTVFYASNLGSHFSTEMSGKFYSSLLNDIIAILEK